MAVLDGVAYVTNSFSDILMAVDVESALAGNCSVEEIALPNDFVPLASDDWGTNGIAPFEFDNGVKGLLLSNEIDGTVFSLQFPPGDTPRYQKIIGLSMALGADGLNFENDLLYVTQNTANMISVWNMTASDDGAIFVEQAGFITSPDYDTPATSALYGGYIFSTNSRFVEKPDIAEAADNTVVGVKNKFATTTEVRSPENRNHVNPSHDKAGSHLCLPMLLM